MDEPKIAREPQPGEWISASEFADVIRLTPLVAIDLIVERLDGRVLVGRRLYEPAKDWFFVPGSRISKNETLSAAFRRVTREELGREFAFGDARFVGVYEHLYPTNRFAQPGYGTHYIVLAYQLDFDLDTTGLPSDQHGEYLWLTSTELMKSTRVHPNTKAYFRAD